MQMMPLMVVCMLTVVYIVRVLVNRFYYKMDLKEAKDKFFKSTIVGVGCTFLYYAYLPITKSGMEIFACSMTTAGVRIMDAAPEIHCNGSEYTQLASFAVVSLLVYGLGIPVFFGQAIYRHRKVIQLEQDMREQESSFVGDFDFTTSTRMRYR